MHEDAVLFNMFFKHHLNGIYLELGALDGILFFIFILLVFCFKHHLAESKLLEARPRWHQVCVCVCMRERESFIRCVCVFIRSVCVY